MRHFKEEGEVNENQEHREVEVEEEEEEEEGGTTPAVKHCIEVVD